MRNLRNLRNLTASATTGSLLNRLPVFPPHGREPGRKVAQVAQVAPEWRRTRLKHSTPVVRSGAPLAGSTRPRAAGTFVQAGLRLTINATTTALNRQSMSFNPIGKAPQCAFAERLSTSRGGSAIGCCPVASLLCLLGSALIGGLNRSAAGRPRSQIRSAALPRAQRPDRLAASVRALRDSPG